MHSTVLVHLRATLTVTETLPQPTMTVTEDQQAHQLPIQTDMAIQARGITTVQEDPQDHHPLTLIDMETHQHIMIVTIQTHQYGIGKIIT